MTTTIEYPGSKRALGAMVRRALATDLPIDVPTLRPLADAAARALVRPVPTTRPQLTGREMRLLILIAAGRTTEQMAAELYLNVTTVQGCINELLAKLRAHNRAHAVGIGFRLGYLGGAIDPAKPDVP